MQGNRIRTLALLGCPDETDTFINPLMLCIALTMLREVLFVYVPAMLTVELSLINNVHSVKTCIFTSSWSDCRISRDLFFFVLLLRKGNQLVIRPMRIIVKTIMRNNPQN